jgi:DNA invertase Pin-like site-specific DNA recombinase
MKYFFAYIRVSTVKQGEHGVSLQEQRDAIQRHALRNGLTVITWFEEKETAAKRGRPIFNMMLKRLKKWEAQGVIIHKIDRSARNLKDWADLGELIDQGIDVQFATESLDLRSRGGRLSADIQAVVAADFIRNLREETRKGFYGRLKQGLYPLPAPLGYKDNGAGKIKELDPAKAPLVRKAFELYGTNRYNLDTLGEELHRLGLRNRNGGRVSRNGLSTMLNNSFYMGLIRIYRTSETFAGNHQPLVSRSLFDRVQRVLRGKTNTRIQRHEFLFRRLLRCAHCGYSLIGERQKGHIYYRCHVNTCPTRTIREEEVQTEIVRTLRLLQFAQEEKDYFTQRVMLLRKNWAHEREARIRALSLTLAQVNDRLGRLTDAYVDGTIERSLFEQRKTALLLEQKDLENGLTDLQTGAPSLPDRLVEFLELAGSAYLTYNVGLPEEKRNLIEIVTSNREVAQKNVIVKLNLPFSEVATRFENSNGTPERDIPRTWDRLILTLSDILSKQPDIAVTSTRDRACPHDLSMAG